MKLFYSPDYTAAAHAFDTTRKAGWIAASLQREPLAGVELVAPTPVTEAQLCMLHDPKYVAAVRTGKPRALAESQGFQWDQMLWTAACASTGGVIAAARAAMSEGVAGSLSSGLHHAHRDHGYGYCTFNGLALAALDALEHGAGSVPILDLDAHFGGGTHALLGGDQRVLHADVSVSTYDYYAPFGPNRLTIVGEASHYLAAIEEMLAYVDHAGSFGLCLYNAGMDPYEDSAEDGLSGITRALLAERERHVFDWCAQRHVPMAFVLAGGYVSPRLARYELVTLHRLTIEAAAGAFDAA